ncbi:hypothetical protein C8R47DRAFT_183810 [Mycena vitilis]|nr:hypothetical protein C8R47DRAFT_183810 [Mycena vitilis]
MQNLVPKLEETPTAIPPMGSLNGTASTQRADSKAPQLSTEPKAPEKQPTAGPSKTVLHPYAFSTQPAYPHTPYYQALPAGFAPYPYATYTPPTGSFPTAAYPTAQPFPPSSYAQQHALFSAVQETTLPPTTGEDTDLPSYEDMIVEGLNDVKDPEGMAPKDLFNWMAAHYPVQSNFRPSASQALQKAFRRGRFEKSTGGRYRLNANWEGGNSSTRRATRRPQTQSAMPAAQKARMTASPFTTVQRPVQHPTASVTTPPVVPQPQAKPPPPAAATPAVSALPTPVLPLPPKQPPQAAAPNPAPAEPPNDPYAAAQNILQSINFGAVFKLEDDERRRQVKVKSEDVTISLAEHARAELQAQLALLAAQLEEIAQEEDKEGAEDEDDDMEEVV